MIKRNFGDTDSVKLSRRDIVDLLDSLPIINHAYMKDYMEGSVVVPKFNKVVLAPTDRCEAQVDVAKTALSRSSHYFVSLDRVLDFVSDRINLSSNQTIRLSKIVILLIMKGLDSCLGDLSDTIFRSLLANESQYLDNLLDRNRIPKYEISLPVMLDTTNNTAKPYDYTFKIQKQQLCATFGTMFYDLYQNLLEEVLIYDGDKQFKIDITEIFDSYYIGSVDGNIQLGSLDESMIAVDNDPTLNGAFNKNTYTLHSISLNRFLSDSSINVDGLRSVQMLKEIWSIQQIYQWFRGASNGEYGSYSWYYRGVNSLYGRKGKENGIVLHYNKWRIPLNIMSIAGDISKSVAEWSNGFASSLDFNEYGSYCLLSIAKLFLAEPANRIMDASKSKALNNAICIYGDLFEHEITNMNIYRLNNYTANDIDSSKIVVAAMAKQLELIPYLRIDEAHTLSINEWLSADLVAIPTVLSSTYMDRVELNERIVIPLTDGIRKLNDNDPVSRLFDSSVWRIAGTDSSNIVEWRSIYSPSDTTTKVARMYALLYKELDVIKRGTASATDLRVIATLSNSVNQLLSIIGATKLESARFSDYSDYGRLANQLRLTVNSGVVSLLANKKNYAHMSYIQSIWDRIVRLGYHQVAFDWVYQSLILVRSTSSSKLYGRRGGTYRTENWHRCVLTNGVDQHVLMIPSVFLGRSYNKVEVGTNFLQLVGKDIDQFSFDNTVIFERRIKLDRGSKDIMLANGNSADGVDYTITIEGITDIKYNGYTTISVPRKKVHVRMTVDRSIIRELQNT